MPTTKNSLLDAVVGHTIPRERILELLARGAVPHALLLAGPSGIGKCTLARALAASFFAAHTSEQKHNSEEITKLVSLGNHPDLHIVRREEGKKDIRVEQIRTLSASLNMKPYHGECSIAIIDEAHRMSLAASNALLKTLEEPAHKTYLFLISDAPQKLPETIVSRCQTMHLSTLSNDEVANVLRSLLPAKEYSEAFQKKLTTICDGSLSALELDTFCEERTFELIASKKLKEHLQQTVVFAERLRTNVRALIDGESTAPLPVALASQHGKKAETDHLLWQTLYEEIRNKLRKAPSEDLAPLANLMQDALLAKQQVEERNANRELVLSTLFESFNKKSQ